ncbi:xanthine dehydrogenase family protein molybdopterin-binding subunit [Kiloniella sp. b19]|uniref:xanthine dehydrogenase family protein molybdopterin-binding subunit n=1 Tax=Kiloniella sp. GXU_MW_B19 TaxID=3141326 RepID=UPI0031D7E6F1
MFKYLDPTQPQVKAAAEQIKPTRRQFLLSLAAGALTVSVAPVLANKKAVAAAEQYAQDFLSIDADGTITVIAKHFEMGQGTTTGLSTIVAEELGADWSKVFVKWAPADATRYNNLLWGPMQGTGGSTATANSYMQLRQAGAVAREALLQAAAKRWSVPVSELAVSNSVVSHAGSGKSATFGELTAEAARVEITGEPQLKDSKDFALFGRHIPRKDSPAKTDGTAIFAMDVRLPGMVTAVLARSPRFGGKLKSFDATAALAVPGVLKVLETSRGVAVLARDTWAAKEGRDLLDIEWDDTAAEKRSSSQIFEDYAKLAETPGAPYKKEGDAEAILAAGDADFEATFQFPYLAHAPMEPLNAVAHIHDGMCEVWAGSQFPTIEQSTAAAITGLKPENVHIHTVYAGGSFGRRATPDADYIAEAVEIAHRLGDGTPVHLVWTREDDIQGGRYRPLNLHRVKARLGDNGLPEAWHHRIVGQSILTGTPFEPFLVKDGIDLTSVEGLSDSPYPVANITGELHSPASVVPALWWRSVGHTHTAFAAEVTIDALARKAGRDALDYRIELLKDHKRHSDVLQKLRESSRWGQPLGKNQGRGVAVHESFGSVVGHVVDITLDEDGGLSVDHITSAVDCGLAINPDVIRAQVESAIVYGLGAMMQLAVTLDEGYPQEDNFPTYDPLRMPQMPAVEVHIVDSSLDTPTGIGEPGLPPIAPAVINAIASITGEYKTRMPLSEEGFYFA